jgi:hypothetical protein
VNVDFEALAYSSGAVLVALPAIGLVIGTVLLLLDGRARKERRAKRVSRH